MSSKKTIKVKEMLEWANHQLGRNDEFATEKFKAGISVMIEKILMDSGNYQGYNNYVGGTTEYCRYYYTSNNLN